MNQLIHSPVGWIHVVAAVLSLLLGTFVLVAEKGTPLHKQTGYAYAVMMVVVNITAFGLYGLFGRFGIFHVAAIISLATLAAGMVPVIVKKPVHWISLHFSFMYWSVIGLYAAFISEMITRIPDTPFFGMLGIATFGAMLVASLLFRKYQKRWQKRFRLLLTASK